MKIEDLLPTEIYYSSLTLLFIVISLIIGVRILLKYISSKKIEHLTIGITWIFISSPWWGVSFSLLTILLFNFTLAPVLVYFLENAFIPIALVTWIYSISHILYPDLEKKLVLIFLSICISFEIYLIASLLIDPNTIGAIQLTIIPVYRPFIVFFQFLAILIALITGAIFSIRSIKLESPISQRRGRFLLSAFIFFTSGALTDVIYLDNIMVMVIFALISRVFLILGAINYYLGFFLPERLSNWLIKKEV